MNQETIQHYIKQFIEFTPHLVGGLIVLVFFWLAGRILANLILRAPRIAQAEGGLGAVLNGAIRAAFVTMGGIAALGTMGVDVKALIAGLGLGGFAVGFALKDMLSNALSGLLILAYRPFHSGDDIAVAGTKGKVREVNLRYTVIEDSEGTRFLVPNAKIFTEVIAVNH